MKKIDVKVDAKLEENGSVVCMVECEGQRARLTFTGTDVLLDVPETRGGIESPPDPADVGVPQDPMAAYFEQAKALPQ